MMEEEKNRYYFKQIKSDLLSSIFKEEDSVLTSFSKVDSLLLDVIDKKKLKENGGSNFEQVSLKGYYHIGKNTVIHPFVSIEGPVFIGDNVTISSHAMIRPFTFIGDGCVVGHASEIKHSVLFHEAKVQSFTFVGDSIIGHGARVGSGAILSNRRFDQKDISISIFNKHIATGTSFFGCVLGDYARIGAGCVTLPGTWIGPYSFIYPKVVASGFIKENVVCRFASSPLLVEEKEKQELE